MLRDFKSGTDAAGVSWLLLKRSVVLKLRFICMRNTASVLVCFVLKRSSATDICGQCCSTSRHSPREYAN